MGGFYCPECDQVRHIAEAGSGEVVEQTGAEPEVDCCWFCGCPVPGEEGGDGRG
jgi:hypothetical protein